MDNTEKRRLARALKEALEYVEREAHCYCLLNEPEYLEIKTMLEAKIRELKESDIDPWTGTPLTPGDPEHCLGNGQHEGYEICCDECPYLMACVPEPSDEF